MSDPIAFEAERHMDGCDAARVAWDWIDGLAVELAKIEDRALLEITTDPWGPTYLRRSDIQAVVLWRRTKPFAVATIIRDAVNWAVLIRWQAGEVA